MYEASKSHFEAANITILTAAVADYTPAKVASEKIKKKGDEGMIIDLVKTVDIAASLGKEKTAGQMLIGFALETENLLENAKKKLESKNLDFIVLNSPNDEGSAFGHDTNKISIIDRKGNAEHFGLKSKKEVSVDILNKICSLLHL